MSRDFVGPVEEYAIFRMDADGHVTTWNAGARRIKGYTDEEAIGLHFSTFFPEEAVTQGTPTRLLAHAEAEGSAQGRGWRVRKDGSRFWADFSLTALYDESDDLAGFTKVMKDVTAHHEYERQLQRQNERLESFASRVSHDLRNPLNIAAGRLELARETHDSVHLDEAANAIDRSLELVGDLLQQARPEEGTEPEPVELAEMAKSTWRTIESTNETLVIETERTVTADPVRLKQILDNLLANAVDHGGTGVTTTVGDLETGFYIADSGTGIPEAEREHVFEEGYSTDEGTGLGLHMVRDNVEELGWDITVTESESGGARFEITGVDGSRRNRP